MVILRVPCLFTVLLSLDMKFLRRVLLCVLFVLVPPEPKTVEYIVGAQTLLSDEGSCLDANGQVNQMLGIPSSLHGNQSPCMFIYLMRMF